MKTTLAIVFALSAAACDMPMEGHIDDGELVEEAQDLTFCPTKSSNIQAAPYGAVDYSTAGFCRKHHVSGVWHEFVRFTAWSSFPKWEGTYATYDELTEARDLCQASYVTLDGYRPNGSKFLGIKQYAEAAWHVKFGPTGLLYELSDCYAAWEQPVASATYFGTSSSVDLVTRSIAPAGGNTGPGTTTWGGDIARLQP